MSREDYELICSELDNTRQRDHPRAYDALSPQEKDALQYWIAHAIQAATKVDDDHSSYGLKHEYERETKLYVSNAQFKGAMLIAGYLPIKKGDQSWHFKIQPSRADRNALPQNQRVHEAAYRSVPQGEQDPRYDELVQAALTFRKANGVIL
jgi:hypothetical protein